MFSNVERYIDFIIKNKLSQSQFLFLYLLHRNKIDSINKYKEAFPTLDGSMIGAFLRDELIDKGFIRKLNDDKMASSYQITERFTDLFLKDIHEATDELFKSYPGFVNINGNPVPLTNTDKYKLALIYGERIDYDVEEHKEIIKDVVFGHKNGFIRSNIENFVRSESWNKLREVRLAREIIRDVDQTLSF